MTGSAVDHAPPEEAAEERVRLGSWLIGVVAAVGVGWQPGVFPLNLQPVDPVLTVIMIGTLLGGTMVGARGGRAAELTRRCAPWVSLIALGSTFGLFEADVPVFGVLQLTRDLFAIAIFFSALALMVTNRSARRGAWFGLVIIAVVCAILVVLSSDYRPLGTFRNPNYAGHFLAAMVLLTLSRIRSWRSPYLPLSVFFFFGVTQTGSFGSLTLVAAGLMVGVWYAAHGLDPALRLLVRAVFVIAVIAFAQSGVLGQIQQSDVLADTALGPEHYERSSEGRAAFDKAALKVAAEKPWGVGPASVVNKSIVLGHPYEIHSDYLGYLVERGVVGLAGLLGLGVLLWVRARPGGPARMLIAGFAVASLTRATLNYRHEWMILAMAFAWELASDRIATPPPEGVKDQRKGWTQSSLSARSRRL